MSNALGIDLGGSSVKAVAVTSEGEVRFKQNVPFDAGEKMDWAEKIRGIVQGIQVKLGKPAECMGLSAPGLASANGRSIAVMPGRLQGLEKLDWTEFLQSERPVPVLNDAHAALLGEAWLGAARGFRDVIMLTLGTGVGGAAMVDGKLLRGHIGRAGHLGHISLMGGGPSDVCGTPGSLEALIGNANIQERTQGRFKSTHEMIAAHQAGDAFATEVWLGSVEALARAICSFVNILDPEAAIIGGGIAQCGPTLFEPLQRLLDPIEWRPAGHCVKLIPAALGEFAGAFGAAKNALSPGPA